MRQFRVAEAMITEANFSAGEVTASFTIRSKWRGRLTPDFPMQRADVVMHMWALCTVDRRLSRILWINVEDKMVRIRLFPCFKRTILLTKFNEIHIHNSTQKNLREVTEAIGVASDSV